MSKSVQKDRWFSCVTYCSEEVVNRVLERKGQFIRAWAYIIHDKENDTHIHILLRTYQSYTYKAIINWFDDARNAVDSSNTFVQKIIDKSGALDYLTHKREPDKVHYSEDCIVGKNLNEFSEMEQAYDSSYEIIQDMLTGVPFRAMAYKYGRDFIYHYKQYCDVVKSIQEQERRKQNDLNSHYDYEGENDYDVPMFESLLKDTIQ